MSTSKLHNRRKSIYEDAVSAKGETVKEKVKSAKGKTLKEKVKSEDLNGDKVIRFPFWKFSGAKIHES